MDFKDEDVALAVRRGASWLDENYPNWANRIDLSKLSMNNCSYCVIGQAVGDYYDSIQNAADSDYAGDSDSQAWAREHGFEAIDFCEDYHEYDSAKELSYYRSLEVLWTDEVKKRLG
jgi:hypothetical protein